MPTTTTGMSRRPLITVCQLLFVVMINTRQEAAKRGKLHLASSLRIHCMRGKLGAEAALGCGSRNVRLLAHILTNSETEKGMLH